PWDALLAPAIGLARDGFVISDRMHDFLDNARNRAGAGEEGRALFYGADGGPLPTGTVVRNPALAQTLERIAREGPDAFYTGENAAQIAARVAAATPHPAGMTEADLANFTAPVRETLCGDYRGYRICGMGPPSSGATTVYAILKQLERFDLG